VIYQVRHLTTYLYEEPVTFARCVMRLSPRPGEDQAVLDSGLTITPPATRLEEHVGQFGERVVAATIQTPHRELQVLAQSRVEVKRPALSRPLGGPAWEDVREQAFATADLHFGSPAHFLYPTAMTSLHPSITDFAGGCFTPGRPVLEAAFDLASTIQATFAYDPKATEVSTPILEAFEARGGVCQDFAHIMIGGLRGLGLPAAYVSGYLRTVPPPGQARLEGADATHAWVDLWCGEDLGWVGLDPTNALVAAGDHIVLARGRDYADVAPIGGVVLGPGGQEIKVGVDVIPLGQDSEDPIGGLSVQR